MRGTKAKRLRRLGLKSGPAEKPEDWVPNRKSAKEPKERLIKVDPLAEAAAELKRKRRRERNKRHVRST